MYHSQIDNYCRELLCNTRAVLLPETYEEVVQLAGEFTEDGFDDDWVYRQYGNRVHAGKGFFMLCLHLVLDDGTAVNLNESNWGILRGRHGAKIRIQYKESTD